MEQMQRDVQLGQLEHRNEEHTESEKPKVLHKQVHFPPQFDWKVDQFNQQDALKKFSILANERIDLKEGAQKNTNITAVEVVTKGSGLTKSVAFILRGSDKVHGEIEIVRKYSDFYELREALVRRWVGCFIPPMPELGNIGKDQKQINKNKLELINTFLKRLNQNESIFDGEQFQIFFKFPQNDVSSSLQKLKAHSFQQLLENYKKIWPSYFQEVSQQIIQHGVTKIKNVEDYFMEKKLDLNYQKDQMKRLAELRTKYDASRYRVLSKLLPEYQSICLDWFNGKTAQNQQNSNEQTKVYSSQKYQNALQAHKDDLFIQEKKGVTEENWLLYELFKFEQKEIDSMLQAIIQYKYLISQRKFYVRNIDNNSQQLQDINNKKLSLKIFLLSGSDDDKKLQLANQTELLQRKLKMMDDIYNGVTQLMVDQIEKFQQERCRFYKTRMIAVFQKEALVMAKLFNLYVQTQRI